MPTNSPNTPELDPETQESVGKVLRRAGTWCAALGLAVAVVGGALGYFIGGTHGMWGAVLGGGLGLIFSLVTIGLALASQNLNIIGMSGIMLAGWFGKMLLAAVGLYFLAQYSFYNKLAFFLAIVIVVLGSTALDALAVQSGRIPYVTPTRLRAIQAEGQIAIDEDRERQNSDLDSRTATSTPDLTKD